MPARATTTPRGVPGRFARLRCLPHGEVAWVALSCTSGFTLIHLVELLAGQETVVLDCRRLGVHVAVGGIAVAVIDDSLHVLDHLRYVPGSAGLDGRWGDAQLVISPVKRALMSGGPLPPRAVILRGLG